MGPKQRLDFHMTSGRRIDNFLCFEIWPRQRRANQHNPKTAIDIKFACFVSFVTAGFKTKAGKTISGWWQTVNLLCFEKKKTNYQNMQIQRFCFCPSLTHLFYFPHKQQLCFEMLLKLYPKYFLNSTFQILHDSSQVYSKKLKCGGETLLKFWYSE